MKSLLILLAVTFSVNTFANDQRPIQPFSSVFNPVSICNLSKPNAYKDVRDTGANSVEVGRQGGVVEGQTLRQ